MTGATTASLQVAPPRRVFYPLTALLACLVVGTRLAGLSASPPGLFRDEAAFGYNGWTIAHFGVDQYGTHWPLFFRSFGDYKGPVGVYLEALLTSFLPLAPWVMRIPNAIAGAALALAAGWLAWRLTRSQAVFLILVLEAAFEPWFFHLGRTMLEVDLLTPLCYVATLALLCAGGEQRLRACIAAGLVLGAACFTAQPARFFTPALLLIVLVAFRRRADPIATLALLALLIAPAAAALAVGVNARRDVISMPFFLVLLAYGWQALVPWLRQRPVRAVAAVILVVLCAIPYYLD